MNRRFQHQALTNALYLGFFKGDRSLASLKIRHKPEDNPQETDEYVSLLKPDNINDVAIAMASSMIKWGLSEWQTGTHSTSNFSPTAAERKTPNERQKTRTKQRQTPSSNTWRAYANSLNSSQTRSSTLFPS